MAARDRLPLRNTPVTALIASRSNNRLGAVYSALHAFWVSRQSALSPNGQQAAGNRRDAYSIVLFDHAVYNVISNDFTSSPQTLLDSVLRYGDGGGTSFTLALRAAQSVMQQHWSTERYEIIR